MQEVLFLLGRSIFVLTSNTGKQNFFLKNQKQTNKKQQQQERKKNTDKQKNPTKPKIQLYAD